MQVLPFPLAWGRCCQKCCPVVSVERSWLVGVSRKAALPLCFQYGLLCVSPQHNSTGCSWLLLPPCLKHPARKGGPGLRGNQCDFRFGQERSVKMEQVEQAASTGYLDGTKCFAVCQVDWAVRRFRYMWQFSHICLISSKRWVAEQHRLDFSLFFFFFFCKWMEVVQATCRSSGKTFQKHFWKGTWSPLLQVVDKVCVWTQWVCYFFCPELDTGRLTVKRYAKVEKTYGSVDPKLCVGLLRMQLLLVQMCNSANVTTFNRVCLCFLCCFEAKDEIEVVKWWW